ncbi:MAG: hypothetical protein KJO42_13840 [Silicimonas sp.]|nr:hypothetical protein [Silicimonas sp.]
MRLRRIALLCLLPLWLAACGGPAEPVWAPDDAVRKYQYRHDGPTEIRLYTVVSTRNGSGAHSGLLINTPDERILFDPAGTFALPFTPERNDVHHGMTENAVRVYVDYHARETFDVIEQRVSVSPAQAREIARLAKSYGAVPKAQCSLAITRILSLAPGFSSIRSTYFPKRVADSFGAMPGVSTRRISDNDADKNHNVLFEAAKDLN